MRIKNDEYDIEIKEDSTYTVDSVDNKYYDIIYNPFGLKRSNNFYAFSIYINNGIDITSCILIGHEPAYCFSCAVLKDNQLTILMRDELIQLDVKQHKINNTIHVNSTWPVLYEIKEYLDGYIIFGELDIIKLNHDFELQWNFSTPDVINEYSLQDNDEILVVDWNNNCYRLNSAGKQI